MDVRPLVIPHAQAAKLIQPRKRPLDHPPPPPEATPVPHATPRHERANPTPAQPTPNRLRVVAAVPEYTVRSSARSTAFALKWGNRIHQGQCFLRVVSIGAGQAHRERDAVSTQIKCRLLPRLARSVGFGPGCAPPHTARTEQLSTITRDQSMSPPRAGQSSSAKCIRSQRPSRCQSRKRRQHVMPDPQSSSHGIICQGIPLRSTNRMPVRQARSGTRGRPPFGRGGGAGKSGSSRSHNASGSSTADMTADLTARQREASMTSAGRFCYSL